MNSIQGHTARIHKDYRSKTRTRGFKMKQQGTVIFGRRKGGRVVPHRNPGLMMPLHPTSRNREPKPLAPAIIALRDCVRKKLQQDIRQQCGLQKVFDMAGWIEQRANKLARQRFDAGFRVVSNGSRS